MSVVLATLCLNEAEWLPQLYEQHKNWPELICWVFVEAADRVYAKCNPDMVSEEGLSRDGTTRFLERLVETDPRCVHIKHGFSDHADLAKGKIAARQRYMEVVEECEPEFLISIDADEFYTYKDQQLLLDVMRMFPDFKAFTFLRREIWRSPRINRSKLFALEVVGGFWGIPCCHWWRWESGMYYGDCHNTPSTKDNQPFNNWLLQMHEQPDMPQMIHMGWASSEDTRRAKNIYYEKRGESEDVLRRWYTKSRAAWHKWRPAHPDLPRNAKVIPYTGPIPEVFIK